MIKRRGQPHAEPGHAHDCPFRAAPVAARKLLGDVYGLDANRVEAVMASGGPMGRCRAAFTAVHGVEPRVWRTPGDWTDRSLDLFPGGVPRRY